MKNDQRSKGFGAPDAPKRGTNPSASRGPGAVDRKPNSDERPSLSLERAEGEGMIAPAPELEGEGSYTATRRYDEGVARSVAEGETERLASEAAEALDGPEGDELRKAEQAAKRGRSS